MRINYITKFLLAVCLLVFYCEVVIYYVVLLQCGWPQLDPATADRSIRVGPDGGPLRVMLLADTHLLGSRNGHWFDKLRREWQMYRAFQTVMSLHNPEVIFVLGDLFDEGLWCSEKEFAYYVKRFHSLFSVPEDTQLYVVVGNHDVGFHYGISPYLHERFSSALQAPSVHMKTIRGNHFVLVNSMALEGDGCFLCRPAEIQLQKISRRLKCAKGIGTCEKGMELEHYSRPIIIQVYDSLKPRLIFDGHTHHGCHLVHDGDIHEWTLPSFSWRNKNNPSFVLAVVAPDNHAVAKCYMPQESTVISVYIAGVALILLGLLVSHRRFCRRLRFYKSN
ncbi:metallophosphoesterase 1 isoform X2 [Bacillus rossius redtenbacheri]|uniref:metallophosphoesterase 1 isoform X2 n=1 Tax=Bacillus rossius redtenbacheri TaxID=93214 RepID=UPI002FDEDE3B